VKNKDFAAMRREVNKERNRGKKEEFLGRRIREKSACVDRARSDARRFYIFERICRSQGNPAKDYGEGRGLATQERESEKVQVEEAEE
jgi:hypothetical protein